MKRRRNLFQNPEFASKRLKVLLARLDSERAAIEDIADIKNDGVETDMKPLKDQTADLKKQQRAADKLVHYNKEGAVARSYEMRILGMQRNYFIALSITLALIFIYFLPQNFLLKSQVGGEHDGDMQGEEMDMTDVDWSCRRNIHD